STRSELVLFGGRSARFALTDRMFVFRGATVGWIELTRGAPTPLQRSGHQTAFDPTMLRRRTIMFGGRANGACSPGVDITCSDTWTWDGGQWRRLDLATGPGPLKQHAMAFHPGLNKIVLFGGADAAQQQHANTWAFDGATNQWTKLQREE